MGWTRYWIVDTDNNLLNTEPVCVVPDGWHKWFEEHIEAMEFGYCGVKESPEESEPAVVERLKEGDG